MLAVIKMVQHRRATGRRLPRQLELPVRSWGGRREGAGRKPIRPDRVPHASRPALASRFPVHVTLKVDQTLPNLRGSQLCRLIEQCFRQGKQREGFRLVHYSIQSHHLHLIVEAQHAQALCSGVKGLSVRVAKRINQQLGRKGRVFVERYFSGALKTPRQVRNCLNYVLLNCRRHDAQRARVRAPGWVDPCSSGRYFDGWRELTTPQPQPDEEPVVCPPHTWLLGVGWRRRGLLSVNDVPGEH